MDELWSDQRIIEAISERAPWMGWNDIALEAYEINALMQKMRNEYEKVLSDIAEREEQLALDWAFENF